MARRLAPAHVLAGPHGATVRRAAEDRASVEETLGRLAPAEREMIPDVLPTVDLAGRARRLARDDAARSRRGRERRVGDLTRSADHQPQGGGGGRANRRAGAAHRAAGAPARDDRRADGAPRRCSRDSSRARASRCSNLRLDLIKLRSSGLGSVMSDLTSATQEARAISRETSDMRWTRWRGQDGSDASISTASICRAAVHIAAPSMLTRPPPRLLRAGLVRRGQRRLRCVRSRAAQSASGDRPRERRATALALASSQRSTSRDAGHGEQTAAARAAAGRRARTLREPLGRARHPDVAAHRASPSAPR